MFVQNDNLIDKATTSIAKIDGSTVADGERLIRAPGTKLQFHVVCPDVPDGQVLNVHIRGALLHPEASHQMVVAGGKTPTLEITAPAQGSFGQVTFAGVHFIPARFDLVGFA
jgi:hypothetical protein